ncbi:MAG TPA: VCBS repeat-containing protein, partial [Chitinophagaceae bacterium]|nr:VCBS repeat-containing protein [Chitinophagaceae bacterium]
GDSSYPMVLKHDLVAALPYLKKKYMTYESYKDQTVEDIFTAEQLQNAVKLEAYTMESSVFINNGKGGFERKALPREAQLSPMYGITVGDFDKDGKQDILMGGNFYESKPEVGIYDASYGVLLKGNGNGTFNTIPTQLSGIFISGAVRDIKEIKSRNRKLMLIALNNSTVKLIEEK